MSLDTWVLLLAVFIILAGGLYTEARFMLREREYFEFGFLLLIAIWGAHSLIRGS